MKESLHTRKKREGFLWHFEQEPEGGGGRGAGGSVVCKEIETQIARGSGVLFGPLVASVRCMKKLVINEKNGRKKGTPCCERN